MSVPAESLTSAFNTVQENLKSQVKLHKRMTEITEGQLADAYTLIENMQDKSNIQDELIKSLSDMNKRYEVLLDQRDDFIASLKF